MQVNFQFVSSSLTSSLYGDCSGNYLLIHNSMVQQKSYICEIMELKAAIIGS